MSKFTTPRNTVPKTYMLLVMRRLMDKLHQEGDLYAQEKSIPWPSRMNSVVSIIANNGPIPGKEIAKNLGYSPQLIAQYLKFLRKTGVIQSVTGSSDKRSKLESLTKNGEQHYQNLKVLEDAVDLIFEDIFEEMGVNLHTLLLNFEHHFEKLSLLQRIDNVLEAKNHTRS